MGNFFRQSPYIPDQYSVKKYGDHLAQITWLKASRETGWEYDKISKVKCPSKGSVNNSKLSNNLSRTKSTVKELVLCNEWDYFCTFTISRDKLDRYNLDNYVKHIGNFIHNYNRRCDQNDKVKYLLIPEQHKDGAWHMHGFIKGIRSKDLYTNSNGYLSWKQYEKKFGFISLSPVRDKEKASSYIQKYISKDISQGVTEINAHAYYASHGLNRARTVYRGSGVFKGSWDYEHPDGYCKIKNIDLRENCIEDFFTAADYSSDTKAETAPSFEHQQDITPYIFNGFIPCFDVETGEIYNTPFD